jgi:hypothetical protein
MRGAAGDVRLAPHADRGINLMGTHAPDVHQRIVRPATEPFSPALNR